jgi:hypothetical protein
MLPYSRISFPRRHIISLVLLRLYESRPTPLHFSIIMSLLAFNLTTLPIVCCFSFPSLPSSFLLLALLKFLHRVSLYDCTFLDSHPSVLFAVTEILSLRTLMSICLLLIVKYHKAQHHYDHRTKVSWICFNCSFILCINTHTLTLYVYTFLRAIISKWLPKCSLPLHNVHSST